MFDLIDDLSAEHWDDKGTPPDNLEEIENIKEYEELHIVTRKAHPVAKEITYTCADKAGKNTKNIYLKHINTAKVDPLKNVRHFFAIIKQIGKEEENLWQVEALLLDMDWCIHKS